MNTRSTFLLKRMTAIAALAALAACSAAPKTASAPAASADMAVKITPALAALDVMHDGKPVTIMRKQDQKNTVNPAFAVTARACPPFCVQPYTLIPGVETIGEVEMLGYLKRISGGDKSVIVVDSRTPDWVARGTIPGSINLPYTKLDESKGADPISVAEAMELFGAKEVSQGWDYSNAKTVVLFCNGMWCGQSPNNIRTLSKMGYPLDKIKWYRGGMQNWENLGLTTVTP
ncbi:MAG TPA: rhodanese-like domain-containing protein [Gallionellaceae bacterium]